MIFHVSLYFVRLAHCCWVTLGYMRFVSVEIHQTLGTGIVTIHDEMLMKTKTGVVPFLHSCICMD